MKKLLLLTLLLFLGFSGYIIYDNYFKEKIPVLEIEEQIININTLYTYGTHLNIEGSNLPNEELELVLYNGEFIPVKINIENGKFKISEFVNDGLYLDDISIGNYYLFLRHKYQEETEKYKYYPLKNLTEYQETTYYTLSNQNKKIVIKNENTYPTMIMEITKNEDNNIYDIVLDPGHGGMDGGATKFGYSEIDFTMDLALGIKTKLEEKGLKVKLTREENQLTKNDLLDEYGVHGRAVVSGEVKAKYLFSLHLNSNSYESVKGLEIYTASDINYDFAKLLIKNIIDATGLTHSNNSINKIYDSIYSRNFNEYDIKASTENYNNKGMIPYDITTKSSYYYIIRETGGIVTGAYVDDRNEKITGNPNYKINTGTETYLLELGYLTNRSDLDNMINKKEKYIEAISKSILTLYKEEEK